MPRVECHPPPTASAARGPGSQGPDAPAPLAWVVPPLLLLPSAHVVPPEGLNQNLSVGASLVAQWLRIHLPMQGTRVQALIREDPTCRGGTKPVRHSY